MNSRNGLTLTAALLLSAAALLALGAMADAAQGEGPVPFGIQPARAGAGGLATGGYFTYTLEPGASVEDEAVVINSGDGPVHLNVYAADGVTAINGSTAFAAANEERTGARSWLSSVFTHLEVAAGDRTAVPFTVKVPPDAAPGDHVAGWVIEAPPKAGTAGGVGATILERAGVAVVVRVPGPTEEKLVLERVCLNQETGSNYFETPVRNEGNVITKGTGTFKLTTPDGLEVFERPAELGAVLPGDATLLRIDAPFEPDPGEYVAALEIEQPDGHRAGISSPIDIGTEKVNGCTAVAAAELKGERGFFSLTEGATPWLLLGLLGGLLLALIAGRALLARQRGGE
jgi:hypothetical protein